MKKVLLSMAAMFFLIVWPGAAIWVIIFPKILGGGVSETYLYPIYGGIILLSGLIVGCTAFLYDEIKNHPGVKEDKDPDYEEEPEL